MGLLTNKNFTQKIIIALVVVILFNFVSPQISFGGIGGTLFEPIKDLTLTLADGAVWIIQKVIFGTDVSTIKMRDPGTNYAAAFFGIVGGAIIAVVGIIATPFTGGVSLAAVAAGLKIAGVAIVGGLAIGYIAKQNLPPDFYLPLYGISPAEIFAGDIAMLDVNFFTPNEYDPYSSVAGTGTEQISAAAQLQGVISQWYFTLRNFAIVALLSILVYTGIRIVVSSSAQDKAKYKQRLLDWLIAMCLLFFLHYIMAFAVTITQLITESVNFANKQYVEIIGSDESLENYVWDFKQRQVTTDPDTGDTTEEVIEVDTKIFDSGTSMYEQLNASGIIQSGSVQADGTISGSGEMLAWPTNLMGKARIEAQLIATGEDEDGDNTLIRQFGYTVIFLALVIYTILFLFRYLKRLLMLAFLTIIAPFVAMTYPLDKMNDGNAQAFNMWLKEYVYNLLIQPVHLILYTILIGSAIDFAASNLLYSLAALGFILQAEKIMRKFFGFEKASTLAGGSALGGALAMQGINMLRKAGGKGTKKVGGGNGGNNGGNNKINYKRSPDKGKSTRELLDSNEKTNTNNNRALGQPAENDGSNTRMLDQPGETQNDNIPTLNTRDDDQGYNMNWVDSRGQGQSSLDHTSAEGRRIYDSLDRQRELMAQANSDEERAKIRQNMRDIRESDTRGLGQAIHDRYQGSSLQAGMHTLGTPVRWTRDKVGSGAKKIGDFAGRTVRSIPKPLRNTIRGASAVVGKGARYIAPRAAKLAVKGTLAGTAAMAGIAAGLVSDDYGNVGKWGAAGAGAGWIAGEGVASIPGRLDETSDKIVQAGEDAATTYNVAAHGPEAEKERQKKISDKRAMQDKERRKLYENKLNLSAKEAKEAMKDAQQYRESGITDDEIIIKAMKTKQFGEERVSKEKIILAGLASEVGKDEKKLKYVEKELADKSVSKEDIARYTEGIKDINDWTV